MAPRKLSDADKSEMVDLYRQPGQTTSTLAEQFGVSSSTVSRILKLSLPPDEYSELISQKRMSGSSASDSSRRTRKRKATSKATTSKATTSKTKTSKATVDTTPAVPEFEPAANQPLADGSIAAEADSEDKDTGSKPTRRRRRRSRSTSSKDEQLPLLTVEEESAESTDEETEEKPTRPAKTASRPRPILASQKAEQRAETEEEDEDDEDDLLGLDETLGDDFGDDDDDLLEEDEDDDDVDDLPEPRLSTEAGLSIMPLDEAVLPKPCYLVVDTRAELITRPLVEFSDLGKIPSSEEKERTLPVFDNHRVARRFSRNKQRVIKVPDGSLITRTSPYLTAKGITRLLVDGQVFDLVGVR